MKKKKMNEKEKKSHEDNDEKEDPIKKTYFSKTLFLTDT